VGLWATEVREHEKEVDLGLFQDTAKIKVDKTDQK
jgi:hypothetical protein